MTKEDRQLLLKDLSARLPYGVIIEGLEHPEIMTIKHLAIISVMSTEPYKPYLRPMSSMTAEEKKELGRISCEGNIEHKYGIFYRSQDYLNSIHVDYRDLIPMRLAIEVTKENNPYENINL